MLAERAQSLLACGSSPDRVGAMSRALAVVDLAPPAAPRASAASTRYRCASLKWCEKVVSGRVSQALTQALTTRARERG